MNQHRWCVVCDDERFYFRTRSEARAEARWLHNHPSNVDIREFGPYRNVDGIARVVDLWSEPDPTEAHHHDDDDDDDFWYWGGTER